MSVGSFFWQTAPAELPLSTIKLCIRQMWPIGDLWGDTRASAHALLRPSPRSCPPQSLRAIADPHTATSGHPLHWPWGVTPWLGSTLHRMAPSLWWATHGMTPVRSWTPSRVVRPTRSSWVAVAECLRGEIRKDHVTKTQSHTFRVKSFNFSGLTLQQASYSFCAFILQSQHLFFNLLGVGGRKQKESWFKNLKTKGAIIIQFLSES